jgi:cytosine/adenosine deaminase-related metal-dependent hydrolase
VHDGRVLAAGTLVDVRAAIPAGSREVDLGDAIVLPGLVNAHVHVELSWMASDPPAGETSFARWVRGVIERRAREGEADVPGAAEAACREMVRRGTVAVGDVSNGLASVAALARSGLAGVVFHEIVTSPSGDAEGAVRRASERAAEAEQAAAGALRVVPAAHAPYTTPPAVLAALAARARATGDPLAIHVAESEDEVELFRSGGGALAELLRERGLDTAGLRAASVFGWLDALGVLGPRTIAVHAVHASDEDVDLLRERRVTVVTCPRSNRALGSGRAPIERMLARGVPVALGTDSLASAPDLDPFAEMAALAAEHPGLPPAAVVRAATLEGARALGIAGRLGAIEPGRSARLVAAGPARGASDPCEVLCDRPSDVRALDPRRADPGE